MKKRIALLCVFSLLLGLLAGCASSSQTPSQPAAEAASAEPAAEPSPPPIAEPAAAPEPAQAPAVEPEAEQSASEPAEEESNSAPDAELAYSTVAFPFTDEPVTLEYYLAAPNIPAGGGIDGYADMQVIQDLEAASGVHIYFNEISFAAYTTQFQLMCASGLYPDMMSNVQQYYSTGAVGAYEDEIIIPLNDLLEENAPDFLRLIESKGVTSELKDDNGNILYFVQLLDSLAQKSGCVVRGDWLDALNMDVPETVSQMEDVLVAFKQTYDCQQPLYMTSSNSGANLAGAFGLSGDGTDGGLMQVDGQITTVFVQEEYLDYIQLLHSWFEKGLFSQDYVSTDYDPFAQLEKTLLATNDVGVWSANLNDLPGYDGVAEEGFYLYAVPALVREPGDVLHFNTLSYVENSTVSISTLCQYPELAANWSNYWYTDEGYLQYNYGVQDLTFTFDDAGEVEYTDMVYNNDLGFSGSQFLRLYCLAGQLPGYQAQRRTACFYNELQNQAWDIWTDSLGDSANTIPSGVTLTAEESTEYSNRISDIETYVSENIPKFILGMKPFEEWDEFIDNILASDIDRCVEIYQIALDRYNNR